LAKGCDQLEDRLVVGAESRLGENPRLGVGQGLISTPAIANATIDNTAIHEKEQDGREAAERNLRPVFGSRQIRLKMQTDIARSFLDDGREMLIIPVLPVMSKFPNPGAGEITNSWT
jgi:hypothetical protein